MTDSAKPLLIVVTGRPGAGKTTFAAKIAAAVRCPLVSRDAIKEGRLNTAMGDVAREVYETFFDVVELHVRRRVTLVAEAAFQHKLWSPKLSPLLDIARVRIVVCSVSAETARARRAARFVTDPDRERFHPDPSAADLNAPDGDYDPPEIDAPTIIVDTSDGYRPSLAEIVSFIQ